jgi:hypothetical protein
VARVTPVLSTPARLVAEHGFGPCDHPDCGGKGFCATDHFYQRALKLARAAFKAGRRERRIAKDARRVAVSKDSAASSLDS